jgi:hypothetical protein
MPLAPGTRLGVYEIGRLIGAGGMGEDSFALDPEDNISWSSKRIRSRRCPLHTRRGER